MIYEATAIVAAYLLGSIPFGLLIPRLYGVGDIRKVGSGNIGATNVLRACGVSGALIVTVLDIAKGAGPVIAAGILFKDGGYLNHDYVGLIVGMAAVIGHIYPLYLGFKGGKGVNTALGVFLVLIPIPTLVALLAFIIIVAIWKYVSLGSISAAAVFLATILLLYLTGLRHINVVFVWAGAAILAMIILTHRSNLKRLFAGTENKISFRKKASSGVTNNG